MTTLTFGHKQFAPRLIIFDKDGTLIDFRAMWSDWIGEVARGLVAATNLPIRERFLRVMDVDPRTHEIEPSGTLALEPMTRLREISAQFLRDSGLSASAAESALAHVWRAPDPVAQAKPLTDLQALFGKLRAHGIQIAVATADDRAATEATLRSLKLNTFISAVVCADDGLPIKPAPDMILTICERLAIAPAQTVMIGDAMPDVQMGRAARVGLVVGVLSGITPQARLAPYVDVVLNSIAEIF